MTIHAFCRRLLGAHPLAAGLDPRFRVLDESEAGRLRDAAIADALDAVTDVSGREGAARPRRLPAVAHRQMAVDLHERLRSQGMALSSSPPARAAGPLGETTGDEPSKPLTSVEVAAAEGARDALAALVREFSASYGRLKQARSALDFADLELRGPGAAERDPSTSPRSGADASRM